MLRISIVTPSYNQGQYLEETILSVLGQNYGNLEYIIMDGGSDDNSVGIIKKYAEMLTYWTSEKDDGQASAINNGFKIATGDILLWLNSDDILMPNVLNYIADTVKEQGNKLFFGDCIHFRKEQNGPLNTWGSNVAHESKNLKLEEFDYIIQPSSFWTREIWNKTGVLNTSLNYGFDWEWFLRVKNNFQLSYVDKCLSIYRFHDSHKSTTGNIKRQQELLAIYKQYCPDKASLYELLMKESVQKKSIIFKLFKKALIYLRRTTSASELLKIYHAKKYARYKLEEIDLLLKML